MCAQDRTNARRMSEPHEGDQLATPALKPVLTRKPKIACLATAGHFTRTLPAVSAHVAAPVVSQPTKTSQIRDSTVRNQLTMPSPDARLVLAISNDSTCQHRRSHAIVQGRLVPFCLRCGDSRDKDNPLVVPSGQNAPRLCSQLITPSQDVRPALVVVNDPSCQHRRSNAFAQGRWISICLKCRDDKKMSALPMLHTMQGFPFDLRRSQAEASRLMKWSMEPVDLDRQRSSFV